MKINLQSNSGLISLINNYAQVLPIDANFIIPPDRSKYIHGVQAIPFDFYQKMWLDPLIQTFPYLSIHESVYDEIVEDKAKRYIDRKIAEQAVLVLSDNDLEQKEEILRRSFEIDISKHTNYEPQIDNKDDRGEVKSLAHIAVKGFLYFCSDDSNAIRLIERASELQTHLDQLHAVKAYDMIYFMLRMKMAEPGHLRTLYKYHYFLSKNDKRVNPSWGDFVNSMDSEYKGLIDQSTGKPTPLIGSEN
jgi:hypothetical protein